MGVWPNETLVLSTKGRPKFQEQRCAQMMLLTGKMTRISSQSRPMNATAYVVEDHYARLSSVIQALNYAFCSKQDALKEQLSLTMLHQPPGKSIIQEAFSRQKPYSMDVSTKSNTVIQLRLLRGVKKQHMMNA